MATFLVVAAGRCLAGGARVCSRAATLKYLVSDEG